jgi:hypothetical protein
MAKNSLKAPKPENTFRAVLRGIVAPIAVALALPAGYVFFADRVPFSVYKTVLILLAAVPLLAVVFWQDIKSFFPQRKDSD